MEIYEQIRKDQKFCSVTCRNSYYNSSYRAQLHPYRKIIDDCRNTDRIIEKVLSKGDRYFNLYELLQLGINLNNALKIYLNCKNEISQAYFGKYGIALEANGYKIHRL